MTIPEWLDSQEATGKDVAHIVLPDELSREEDPEETIFYNEIRECSILCDGDHPFATVERYGNWYLSRGRKKDNGPHTSQPQWWMFTKDRDLAVRTAQMHMEKS